MAGSLPRRLAVAAFCALVGAAPGVAAQLINIQSTDPSSGGVAVSGLSDASSDCVNLIWVCAPGVAVSGTGNADSGGLAAAGTGTSTAGFAAVSGMGSAYSDGASVATLGNANGTLIAVTVIGNASCGDSHNCFAISLLGSSTNGTAISGCDILSKENMQAECGQGAYSGAYWAAWDLLG